MTIWKALQEKYQAWLNRISEANRREFGEKAPDCCGLLNDRKSGHRGTDSA